eukprot:scaffold45085_cov19-Tisochrysis_lutea.AAC.3
MHLMLSHALPSSNMRHLMVLNWTPNALAAHQGCVCICTHAFAHAHDNICLAQTSSVASKYVCWPVKARRTDCCAARHCMIGFPKCAGPPVTQSISVLKQFWSAGMHRTDFYAARHCAIEFLRCAGIPVTLSSTELQHCWSAEMRRTPRHAARPWRAKVLNR